MRPFDSPGGLLARIPDPWRGRKMSKCAGTRDKTRRFNPNYVVVRSFYGLKSGLVMPDKKLDFDG
jgi:hypothetical protein